MQPPSLDAMLRATDETPEAPSPAPTLTLYMAVRENDAINGDFTGGRVMFGCVKGGRPLDVLDASMVIAAGTDAWLVQFPWKTPSAKRSRFFRVTVEEVPADLLPPDPEYVREIEAAERRLAEIKARAGAP